VFVYKRYLIQSIKSKDVPQIVKILRFVEVMWCVLFYVRTRRFFSIVWMSFVL
jgi:hypothetical protein